MPRPTLHVAPRCIAVPAALAAGLTLAAGAAAAHPPGHPGGPGSRAATVSVAGEGQSLVSPDLATVSVGVTTQAPTAAQAMNDNSAKQARVIEAVKAQGIAPQDLQTQGLNLSPMQDFSRENQPPVIAGYQAQNIVSVRVHDVGKLGGVLDALVGAGATDVQGVVFTREDDGAARDAARADAVRDARRRAEVMARAAGMELGPLLSLTEGGDPGRPMPMMAMARDAKAQSTPVEAGELILGAHVDAVWALAPVGGPDGVSPAPGRRDAPGGKQGRTPGEAPGGGPAGKPGALPGDAPPPVLGDAPPPAPGEAPPAPGTPVRN